jgi:hypothetical protein
MGALKSPKCSKGHRMIPANLYYFADGTRKCRKCAIAYAKAARLRKLAKAS